MDEQKWAMLCCFCVLSHCDGAMSWCDELSLFDDRSLHCIAPCLSFGRGQNDELVASHQHGRFADVATF